jgi:hypothetical protein
MEPLAVGARCFQFVEVVLATCLEALGGRIAQETSRVAEAPWASPHLALYDKVRISVVSRKMGRSEFMFGTLDKSAFECLSITRQ